MNNLDIYNKVRTVPAEALKQINAGRLKGMSDINPMWRIKTLTELFGASGDGWYFDKVTYSVHSVKDELVVMCEGYLNYRNPDTGEWGRPVYGVGGSKMAVSESKGLYIDDEAYKKAYTDMQSVACKALGIGADVYWSKDSTKYTRPDEEKISADGVRTIDMLMKERAKADREQTGAFFKELQKKYGFKKYEEIPGSRYIEIVNEITKWRPET